MSTHNICICSEIRKILCGYPLLSVAMSGAQLESAVSDLGLYAICSSLSVLIL